jgi:peroxiredoxin
MKHPRYIPEFEFLFFNPYHGNFLPKSSKEIFGGKKTILLGLPGAFTPTCTNYQMPEFDERAEELKSHGIDQICAVLVNDGWVLGAWARELGLKNIQLLGDGNGEFTEAMNMLVSYKHIHFGWRSWRYSCLVDDMKIEKSWIEEGFTNHPMDDPYEVCHVANVLEYLKNNESN